MIFFFIIVEAWRPERTSCGGAIDKQQFHDLVANVEVAEEQPAAQIAAACPKKELPWKKSDGI